MTYIDILKKYNLKNLVQANLKRADLEKANLKGVNLQEANLKGVNLKRADLEGADLEKANLKGADLRGANLQEANLEEANLLGANIWRTNLRGANLIGVNLIGVNLQGANLVRANLQEANLQEANLEGADLREADLSQTKGLINPIDYLRKNFEWNDKGVIVYKKFNSLYSSPHSWVIEPFYIITEECNANRADSCGSGVNAATLSWCKNNFKNNNTIIWRCLIRFEWLSGVIVPYNTDGKIRCCKLQIISPNGQI